MADDQNVQKLDADISADVLKIDALEKEIKEAVAKFNAATGEDKVFAEKYYDDLNSRRGELQAERMLLLSFKGKLLGAITAAPQACPGSFVGSLTEGLNARKTKFFTPRQRTVTSILQLVQRQGAILIKAPPQSGKTSLLQLLYNAARGNSSGFSHVTFASMGDAQAGASFLQVLEKVDPQMHAAFTAPSPSAPLGGADSTSGGRLLLLVDEAEVLSREQDHALRAKIKGLSQGRGQPFIILAVACGSAPSGAEADAPESSASLSPVVFPEEAEVTLAPASSSSLSVALTEGEYDELLAAFNAYAAEAAAGLQLTDKAITSHLYRVTSGQVGMITAILDSILEEVRNLQPGGDLALLDQAARHLLTSPHSVLSTALPVDMASGVY